ncbi:MAG TPA: PleD family two-component system response regulator, partial [Afifellaceae bacterium]|nr:PleD family two-component system response regulator [Afifellaceae bacterium]
MTARILVVDDVLANVRLLEVRLKAEYFDVKTALNGQDALDIAIRDRVDLVLLDVMMPGMDGLEVCRRLKDMPETAHIPVVMVTALDGAQDRIKGLEAGADDFLTKPVSEIALITRVKSLLRLKMMTDELSLRAATMQSVGVDTTEIFSTNRQFDGRVLLVDDRPSSIEKVKSALGDDFSIDQQADPAVAFHLAETVGYDLIITSLNLSGSDGLRFCSQVKMIENTRYTPVLLISDPDEKPMLLRALDLGVNDYIIRPIEVNELRARVQTQLRRKVYADRLRGMVTNAVELAITDPLTGLHNRRYLDSHLRSLVERSANAGKPMSVLAFDLDFFKGINDTYGHDAGDDVLREFAHRLKKSVRGIDLVVRHGGEEFVVVMPETDLKHATNVADRLRQDVEGEVFNTSAGDSIPVTVSVGVSEFQGPSDTAEALMRRADQAL